MSVASMATAFFPGLVPLVLHGSGPALAWILLVYVWTALAMAAAWALRRMERSRWGRRFVPLLLYVVGYGPLLCAITLDAMLQERRGVEARWEKTEKIGRVAV